MRMSRWISEIAKLGRTRNERMRRTTKSGEIFNKVQETGFKWYGHGMERAEGQVGERVMVIYVPGKRRK